MSGYNDLKTAFPLGYGSAQLEGFKYRDTVCLGPINAKNMDAITPELLSHNFCVKDMKL